MTILSFHETRFPDDISFNSEFGPEYSTDIVTMINGSEQRNINWSEGRCVGNVAQGIKNAKQFDKLLSFFRNRKGKAFGFRFKDWSDFNGRFEIVARGDGLARVFQIVKNYDDPDINIVEQRTVKKIVTGTVRVFTRSYDSNQSFDWRLQSTVRQECSSYIPNNSEMTGGWSVNYNTGKITFDNPIPVGTMVLVSFEFDVPVRFDTDKMPVNFASFNAYDWKDIPIIELKIN